MANSASFSWSMASSPPPEPNKNDPKGCSILPVPCVSQLSSDNGFAERAARFSCFRSVVMDNSAHLNKLHVPSTSMDEALTFSNHPETLSKRSGAFPLGCSPALGNLGNSECDEAEVSTAYRQAHAVEESCSSEQVTGEGVSASQKMTPINARKRKQQPSKDANPDKQIKTAEVDESKNLRQKVTESIKERDDVKAKVETSSNRKAAEGSPNEAEENAQGSDYIHVRARRGQATNSHSLAERVRREKISERMKFLQDLVPGCSKVTGKAVMLDEIINYVQSLQRQVEFLSMKLAAVNPQIDLNVSRILAKDGSSAAMMFTSDPSTSYPHFHHPQHGIVQVGSEVLSRTITSQLPCIDGFDSNNTQLPNVWDDELQSVVQMGFGHNTHIPQTSQQRGIGPVTMPHMKPDV